MIVVIVNGKFQYVLYTIVATITVFAYIYDLVDLDCHGDRETTHTCTTQRSTGAAFIFTCGSDCMNRY